jgi:hypothetical protein
MIHGAACALDGSVLVLNKVFMAVHVISVRRAFCLLFVASIAAASSPPAS